MSNMTGKELLLSLYGTQILVAAVTVILFITLPVGWNDIVWFNDAKQAVWIGTGFGISVVMIDLLVAYYVPYHLLDDGGINERIFTNRSVLHILFLALIIAVSEEILFRGVLQHQFGIWWTSLLFTAIHFRYLRQWVLLINITFVSFGLGLLVQVSGMLIPAIIAHFIIDFTLGLLYRYGKMPKRA